MQIILIKHALTYTIIKRTSNLNTCIETIYFKMIYIYIYIYI